MHVVGCPLAAAVVARIESILKRVAIFLRAGSNDASTANRKPPRVAHRSLGGGSLPAEAYGEGGGNENYNGEMFLLRYIYILALVIWLGGMVVAGAIVAPSIFEALRELNVANDRFVGGQVFGEVLRRLHLLGYAMGAVMFIALTMKRLLGPRPVGYGIRVGIIGAMLAFSMYSGYMVEPQVAAITRDVGGAVTSLPATDARRVEFDRLHMYSTWLFGLTAFGGLVLLAWEARE